MTTKSLHSLIQSVKIHYEMVSSDHFPLDLALELNIPHSQPTRCGSERGKRIKWSQLSEAERDNYKLSTDKKLSRIRLDLSVLMCEDTTCSNPSHLAWIESFYNETVEVLLDAGLEFAESTSGKTPIIPGWNEMCAEIHTQARNCFLQWRSAGSPKSGPMYDNMRISKAHFKLNLRNCKADKDRTVADSLANNLLGKDSRTFWKEIQQIAGNKNTCPAQTIDGITGSQEICNMWKGHFTSLLNSCRDFSKRESVEKRVAVVTYADRYKPDDVANAIKELKRNKSPGADMLTSEHFLYASEKLHVLLSVLFNCVNIHGYLPSRLMETIIVPIVKDNKGILTDKNNYRPIALTCVASKLLEVLILDICSDTITTTDSQFGFKENHSTDMCIFTLKETVQYYVSLGSPVYLCFMDASKAFDKVNHWHLFDKLLNCGVPVYVVRMLLYWHTYQDFIVRWNNTLSPSFKVSNVVRQGGILSPRLFSVYIDDLSKALSKANIGCHLYSVCTNHLFYADDSVLLAPSPVALNQLLDICEKYSQDFEITYNATKTVCMFVRPKHMNHIKPVKQFLYGSELNWVDAYKYLGCFITSDLKDDRDIRRQVIAIYCRGNMIIRKFSKCSVDVKNQLFRSYVSCLYGCALWKDYSTSSFNMVRVAYNNVYRALMGIKRVYGHSISSEYVNNCIDGFEATQRKLTSSLRGRLYMSSNTIIAPYISSRYFMFASPLCAKWNRDTFVLR